MAHIKMKLKTADYKRDIFYLMNKYSGIVSGVETEMLLEYLFNCAKLDLYIRDFAVNETIEELYDSLVERRLSGEPAQYITGRAEFMGLDFIVTKDTLIPRPETEILVNEIQALCSMRYAPVRILDLCTGSGNIAISLAKLMPQAEITATDVSEAALKIAEKNAARHNARERIRFYKGDVFNALVFDKNPKFDIIVCNPPYIKEGDFPYLQKEVRQEPEIALNGGKDGLGFYRVIAKEAYRYLERCGSVLLEMGFGQRQAIEDVFSSYNIFETY
ncbi:MAG: peptide chain release factor N(5)-glutamine methyltransferase, partial [Candidatus Omnitrophota bacterium]|nr:peptide chain release factor N(5)-glutamine methyltransferase [Candidatus Omnitrophota bacterium]